MNAARMITVDVDTQNKVFAKPFWKKKKEKKSFLLRLIINKQSGLTRETDVSKCV
jgi:hypothetical protein